MDLTVRGRSVTVPSAAPLVTALGCLLAAAGIARGHPSHAPAAVDRYVKLVAGGPNGRLVYTVTFGDLRAVTERLTADANGDRVVSDSERDRYARSAARRIASRIDVRIDDRPSNRLEFESPWVEPLRGPVAQGLLVLELHARLPIGGAGRRVCVRDRNRFDGLLRTELGIEAASGTTLSRAGFRDTPEGISTYEAFAELPGAPADRLLCAHFDAAFAPPIERPGRLTVRLVAAIAGAVGVAVGLWLWRRRLRA